MKYNTIHPKMYYVYSKESSEVYPLAYMCHAEDNAAFRKRASTGKQWAGGYKWEEDTKSKIEEGIFENVWREGFQLTGLVSRYTTSNKFYRVIDPRGFTVEIDTHNLLDLLLSVKVDCGRIESECKWARDSRGMNILIAKGSVEHEETCKSLELIKKRLNPRSVKVGDQVTNIEDGKECVYLGKYQYYWRPGGYRHKLGETVSPRRRAMRVYDVFVPLNDKGLPDFTKPFRQNKMNVYNKTRHLELGENVPQVLFHWSIFEAESIPWDIYLPKGITEADLGYNFVVYEKLHEEGYMKGRTSMDVKVEKIS